MNIWRLNVKVTQIGECIHSRKFAVDSRPRNPEMQKGDILLLQMVLVDARRVGKQSQRIEYALIFDHFEEDYSGTMSSSYWPDAGKTWRWILHCSDIVQTIPFSLENLSLSTSYAGQTNPVRINESDALKIMQYLVRYKEQSLNEIGDRMQRVFDNNLLPENSLWDFINNNDRIVESAPDKIVWETVPEHKIIKRNAELPFALKHLYNFTCQVCEKEFKKDYGVPYSETHHIVWLSRGGVDHSNNLIVVCPNHHRIIHESYPVFDRKKLAFMYRNGREEHLKLTSHFKDPTLLDKVKSWAEERAKVIEREKGT